MPSSKEFLNFILDQTSSCGEVSYRAMMGEYIVYYSGKIVGGIYDDRFLVKKTDAAKRLIPDAPEEVPYEGAKKMLLVENVDDRDFLEKLLSEIFAELYLPKGVF